MGIGILLKKKFVNTDKSERYFYGGVEKGLNGCIQEFSTLGITLNGDESDSLCFIKVSDCYTKKSILTNESDGSPSHICNERLDCRYSQNFKSFQDLVGKLNINHEDVKGQRLSNEIFFWIHTDQIKENLEVGKTNTIELTLEIEQQADISKKILLPII